MRYERQIIVNPDLQGPMKQPPLSTEAAKKAMAAGVKPAALITRIPSVSQAVSNLGRENRRTSARETDACPTGRKRKGREGRTSQATCALG